MRNNNARFTIHAGEAFGLPSIQEALLSAGQAVIKPQYAVLVG